MSDLQAIADRVEIGAVRGESVDALMMRDHDRFAVYEVGSLDQTPLVGSALARVAEHEGAEAAGGR
jgi:hypothetical protein